MKFVMPKVDKLLNDKNVLYVVFALAILNLMGYLLVQNTEAIVFFLIVGFLSTYFSKNMIIVLIIAMVSTSIFTSTRGRYVKEGMRTSREAPKEEADKKEDKSTDSAKKSDKDKKKMSSDSEMDKAENDEEDEPEAMSNKSNTKKNRLDYAGNLAEAYNNLQKTIGKGGIKALTGQTETLLNQQKNLMDNIKGMEPFIKTAESFMSKLDLGGINGMLSKLGGK
jgi:Skp family chaperone for outer membrane proteins